MYMSIRPNQGYKTYPHVPGFALSWSVSAKMLPYQTGFVAFWFKLIEKSSTKS